LQRSRLRNPVGLHCHEVVHGELVLGDRAPSMVLDVALDEPPLEEQPRILRQDRFLRYLAGDCANHGGAAAESIGYQRAGRHLDTAGSPAGGGNGGVEEVEEERA